MTDLRVWFRTFEDLVAKKIQCGDLDEAKMLLQLRGEDFQNDKIARLLNKPAENALRTAPQRDKLKT